MVVFVVCARTGRVRTFSTTGLTVISTAIRPVLELDSVVLGNQGQLFEKRQIGVFPVTEEMPRVRAIAHGMNLAARRRNGCAVSPALDAPGLRRTGLGRSVGSFLQKLQPAACGTPRPQRTAPGAPSSCVLARIAEWLADTAAPFQQQTTSPSASGQSSTKRSWLTRYSTCSGPYDDHTRYRQPG